MSLAKAGQDPDHYVLVVFDIDGTLIDLAGAGRQAMSAAFASAFGLADALDGTTFAGRTDRAIVRAVLEAAGVVDPEGRCRDADVETLYERYLSLLPREVTRRPYTATPGARALLEALSGLSFVRIGLATGNIEEAAQIKLAAAGLDVPFRFGAYGHQAEDRSSLLAEALRRARETLPERASVTAWVAGDTPHDVFGARAVGALSLAVAQGPYSERELAKHGPDIVVPDLAAALDLRFWMETGSTS